MVIMTIEQATQIADLLNSRNQLSVEYSGHNIIQGKDQISFIENDGLIIACGEFKKVQWYQWEICHVSVLEKFEGNGFGSTIVKRVESKIKDGGGRIAQCTIRNGNHGSELLFLAKGYLKTISFYNSSTGNGVNVYQKNITEFP